ncbi:ATP-binding cassette sub- B member 6, mitochondrial, partial [Lunasporangiospora selenospora]
MVLMHLETTGGGHWSWPVYYFWWLALLGESLVILYHYWLFTKPEDPSGLSKDSSDGVTVTFEVDYVILFRVVFLVRYALWWMLALLSLVHAAKERRDDDLEALRAIDTGAPGYGTFGTNGTAGASGRTRPITSSSSDEEIRKRLSAEEEERANAFKDFWPKIKRLLPFVYPREKSLQLLILLTFVLIGLGRVVNLLVPIMTEKIVRDLNQNNPRFDVGAILLYVLVRFLQGSSGLVGALRGWAWIPIEQYSNRTLTLRFFEHVQNLSLQFHLNRKTGELLRILDRGTSSIVSLLSTVLFQLVPVIADVTIAVVYFCKYWSWKYAVIVFITIISYIIVTVVVTEWRTRFRRAMISFDNDARAKAVDSLLNFETVKYYTAEHFEQERYREAIEKYQTADYKSQVSYQLLNLLQSFVITMGMLAGCLLCAYEISRGERDVSSFVTFIVYLNQLYQPLNWFGTYYRMLQQNFVDMEKMIKLLDENQSVKDVPGAGRLVVTGGEVVFENVCFQYDSRQKGLSNVSFRVPKGKTVALVGPTGSGKSTILRLLF